ncbi:serine/threonine-protein phosphatase [Bifidobacterium callitrichos]|uniref:Serine/threonine-protein phosphatase n=1 Tax=Bifidobacterium callitrichos TaxID=762209 RepID=A0A5M9ZEK4_9BIFI|nr:protein phosphatase 2C domain-containing protein [Bifidobacterium callitrichos]KAA8816544.1 serine/threonine-protein phosphatase [Bifidobacterium callitrichos]
MSASSDQSHNERNEQTQSLPRHIAQDAQDATETLPLTQRSAAASDPQQLFLCSTTVSDVGTVRANNQDSSFAGAHLIAICDGMGGHAGGDTASTIAIRSLAHIERDDVTDDVAEIASMMETSVMAAHDAIVGKARRERKLSGMGTTVTAVALVAGYWVLAHIGDSRAYLLRDGVLSRATQDHSYVQHLINTGRITEAEAKNHPQRNVVMRVLGDFDIDPHPDIAMFKAHAADRWLLCSDGLCGVLEDSTIAETMTEVSNPGDCAQQLVSMALRAGSTDNVTAVIGDATMTLDAHAFDLPHQTPLVGGAASASLEPIADIVNEPIATAPALRDDDSPAQRAAALAVAEKPQHDARDAHDPRNDGDSASTSGTSGTSGNESGRGDQGGQSKDESRRVVQPSLVREENGDRPKNPDTGEIPVVTKSNGRISTDPNDPEVAQAIRAEQVKLHKTNRARRRRRRVAIIATIVFVLAAIAGALFGVYRYSQSKYYVGTADGYVAIYQGVPTSIANLTLSHEVKRTAIKVSALPASWHKELEQGIVRDNYSEAESHVELIRDELASIQKAKAKKDADAAKAADGTSTDGTDGTSTDGASADGTTDSGASTDQTTTPQTQTQTQPQTQEGGAQQ